MSAPPPNPPPAPPGAEPDVRRRIHRRTDGHLLGGVASGIADHLDVDPVLVRVAFVVLTIWPFPGFGALLYLAFLFLLPTGPDGQAPSRRSSHRQRGLAFYVGVALLTIALMAILGVGSAFAAATGGLWIPLLLIGIGVALWVSDRGEPSTSPPGPSTWRGAPPAGTPYPPAPATAATAARADDGPVWDAAAGPVTGGDADAAGAAAGAATPRPADQVDAGDPGSRATPPHTTAAAWPYPDAAAWQPSAPRGYAEAVTWEPPPPRPRSPLGRVTLGAALTVAATLWALRIVGLLPALAPSVILAATLATVGVGLLVGSVAGRARWLAWLAAPLAAALLVTAVLEDLDLPLDAGVGDRVVLVPGSTDGVVVERLGAGRLVVDLTRLDPDTVAVEAIDVRLGAGEVEVVVPEGVRLTGRARVEVGQFDVRGEGPWRSFGGLAVDEPIDVGADDGVEIAADVRVAAGQITVRDVPVDRPTEEAS